MIGPLVQSGIITPFTDLVFAFGIGIAFGIILEQGGFSSGRNITAVFYGRNFAVPKVMFTAMITATLGILLFNAVGLMDATKLFLPPTYLFPHIIGGILFGVGMVVSGYCPGTSVVSSAIGRVDAMVALGGMVIGTFAFNEFYPLLKDFMYTGSMGKTSLVDFFGLPAGFVLLILFLFALSFFFVAGIVERKFGGKKEKVYLGPWNKTTARWLIGSVVVFAIIAGSGALSIVPGKTTDKIKGIEFVDNLSEDRNALDAKSLEKLINSGSEIFFLVDLRNEDEFTRGSLPGAYNIPVRKLTGEEGVALLPTDRKIVLYDQDGASAFQVLPILRYNGFDVTALAGGLLAWAQLKSGSNGAEFKLETPAAAPPPPPPSKKSGKPSGGFKDEGC